jgi:hypothetical protein
VKALNNDHWKLIYLLADIDDDRDDKDKAIEAGFSPEWCSKLKNHDDLFSSTLAAEEEKARRARSRKLTRKLHSIMQGKNIDHILKAIEIEAKRLGEIGGNISVSATVNQPVEPVRDRFRKWREDRGVLANAEIDAVVDRATGNGNGSNGNGSNGK